MEQSVERMQNLCMRDRQLVAAADGASSWKPCKLCNAKSRTLCDECRGFFCSDCLESHYNDRKCEKTNSSSIIDCITNCNALLRKQIDILDALEGKQIPIEPALEKLAQENKAKFEENLRVISEAEAEAEKRVHQHFDSQRNKLKEAYNESLCRIHGGHSKLSSLSKHDLQKFMQYEAFRKAYLYQTIMKESPESVTGCQPSKATLEVFVKNKSSNDRCFKPDEALTVNALVSDESPHADDENAQDQMEANLQQLKSSHTKPLSSGIICQFRKKVIKLLVVENFMWALMANDAIQITNLEGNFEQDEFSPGFSCGLDMCADSLGNVIVASRDSGLYRLDPDGEIVDVTKGHFSCITSTYDTIWAIDDSKENLVIQKFASTPCELAASKKIKTNIPNRQERVSLAEVDDALFLSSSFDNCIFQINPDTGTKLHTFGQTGYPEAGGLNCPLAIMAYYPGWLMVVDQLNDRLQILDVKSGQWSIVQTKGQPMKSPTSVFLCLNGNLYIAIYDQPEKDMSSVAMCQI